VRGKIFVELVVGDGVDEGIGAANVGSNFAIIFKRFDFDIAMTAGAVSGGTGVTFGNDGVVFQVIGLIEQGTARLGCIR